MGVFWEWFPLTQSKSLMPFPLNNAQSKALDAQLILLTGGWAVDKSSRGSGTTMHLVCARGAIARLSAVFLRRPALNGAMKAPIQSMKHQQTVLHGDYTPQSTQMSPMDRKIQCMAARNAQTAEKPDLHPQPPNQLRYKSKIFEW